MNKILVIDNYDSFTYNLVHMIEAIRGHAVAVWRNDQIDYDTIQNYEYIILSPGPGIPEEAGDLLSIVQQYSQRVKMLGVCLGHQAIGEAYGAELQNLSKVYHGVSTTMIRRGSSSLLEGLDDRFDGGRYHSWVIRKNTLPEEFAVTSTDEHGEIMSFRHRNHDLYGVQFHPESILTPMGERILMNFLNL